MSKIDETLKLIEQTKEQINVCYEDYSEWNKKVASDILHVLSKCEEVLNENKKPTQIWAMEHILNEAGFVRKEKLWVDYRSHITTQEMKSRDSCIYALQQIKKDNQGIKGYCVPK